MADVTGTQTEALRYANNFYVFHLRRSGRTNEQTEKFLKSIPLGQSRDHFINQYIRCLPAEERQAAAARLNHPTTPVNIEGKAPEGKEEYLRSLEG